jgi:hypothetical protein
MEESEFNAIENEIILGMSSDTLMAVAAAEERLAAMEEAKTRMLAGARNREYDRGWRPEVIASVEAEKALSPEERVAFPRMTGVEFAEYRALNESAFQAYDFRCRLMMAACDRDRK